MNSFLYKVAQWLVKNYQNSFSDICLVYPNQRTGVFLTESFKSLIDKPVWLPLGCTINEFVERYTTLRQTENIELLSILYKVYKSFTKTAEPFDDFYFWGELMLNDFNDIDKYLANADIVLQNVASIKDMESNWEFLDEEQISVLKRFFNNFDVNQKSKLKDEFLKVWQVLLPVYKAFKQELISQETGYEGMVYQSALEGIKQKLPDFDFKKVIFIGFNAITPVEEEIFSLLKKHSLATFCWDYDEYYIDNKLMEAGMFQRKFIKEYPNTDLNDFNNLLNPEKSFDIISVPTDFSQLITTSQIIQSIDNSKHSNTAVVLSDEQLLLPLLNNLPNNVNSLNVTMGYPLHDTLAGNLLDQYIGLQQTARVAADDSISYYYKSVLPLLRNAFIQELDATLANEWIAKIEDENLYYIALDDLQKSDWKLPLFSFSKTMKDFAKQLKINFERLIGWLNANDSELFALEKEFVYQLYLKNNQLYDQLANHEIELQLSTYFRLLKKITQGLRIPFEGEPVEGLQIMGFLETRNLDFEHVIILSVNEGVLPISNQSPSFMPYGLRRGFGLPTKELHDAMYAYYFYRIIQRAKHVTLIYNSGSGGMQSGEKSRFIYQLQYDKNFTTREFSPNQTIEVANQQHINIPKSANTWLQLEKFLKTEKKLSPSALSTFIECPLKFYFKNLAKIKEPDEVEDKVDARLFGNIFHRAAEKMYMPFFKESREVTLEELLALEKNINYLDVLIQEAFKDVFLGEKSQRNYKVEGKNTIVFKVIKKYLLQLIENDKNYVPFSIIGLELDVENIFEFELNRQQKKVKLGGQIDRLDRTKDRLRVIDYKTGGDKLEFDTVASVFDHEFIRDTKAIFQTFVYSYMVSEQFADRHITPMIYQIKNLFDSQSGLDISSKTVTEFENQNFNSIKMLVKNEMQHVLSQLFDPNSQFVQTENKKSCEYCTYKVFCGR